MIQLWVLKPDDGWWMVGFFLTLEEAKNYYRDMPNDSRGIFDVKYVKVKMK